jgi:pyridinium-3,5-biscarboxylic acid mononucleotide sulfurtransferase
VNSPALQTPTLIEKIAQLRVGLAQLESVIVCFSGGIDSALLLALAHQELQTNALGITAVSPSLPASEREEAAEIAKSLGATHAFVDSHEIENPDYVANQPDRCFHCKTELYTLATRERDKRGFKNVISGIIVDDLGDYRPGIEAARNHGVRFPLVEAGFNKQDVRDAAVHLGISIWNKPAAACLSSRIAYGTSVTRERLQRVSGFETELKAMGFERVRVRYHEFQNGNLSLVLGRIELNPSDIARASQEPLRQQIVDAGKRNQFQFITLDLAGYRQGSLNEVLKQRHLPVLLATKP